MMIQEGLSVDNTFITNSIAETVSDANPLRPSDAQCDQAVYSSPCEQPTAPYAPYLNTAMRKSCAPSIFVHGISAANEAESTAGKANWDHANVIGMDRLTNSVVAER
mmetsp:Transcript_65647/g.173872  ORF Transcript_65647/g.173872 Transcript_65647/m.173872 type:complete len:107 (+) Transcript_65647:378-698(+)